MTGLWGAMRIDTPAQDRVVLTGKALRESAWWLGPPAFHDEEGGEPTRADAWFFLFEGFRGLVRALSWRRLTLDIHGADVRVNGRRVDVRALYDDRLEVGDQVYRLDAMLSGDEERLVRQALDASRTLGQSRDGEGPPAAIRDLSQRATSPSRRQGDPRAVER